MSELERISEPFRLRARVLQLLGDELIGSARLAVFELVKNAYDADASKVDVTLDLGGEPAITVDDDGEGMTLETLRSVWLVPGDDHRQKQREADRRTPRHGRLPLGEKGLGRFAAHKLGDSITLTTRAENSHECVVGILWTKLVAQRYLDEAPIMIEVRRRAEIFAGGKTGTRIEIRKLRATGWSRREIRNLYNQVTSICSPFGESGGFRVDLQVPGREDWIADLPDVSEILNRAVWKFRFRLDDGRFDWRYEFRQIPGLKLDGRIVEKSGDRLKLPASDGRRKNVVADGTTTDDIGPVSGELHVYDLDREIRQKLPNIRILENYLDQAGGVRVYRDGIRVYNYGEAGDDWLGLDLRRVNLPTRRISRNIVLGAIHLSLKDSSGLKEKTNREGFVENDASGRLKDIVLGAVSAFEEERHADKLRIRRLAGKTDSDAAPGIEKPIEDLRRALKRRGMLEEMDRHIVRIEKRYRETQEILLSASMSGLNLAVVFHEVERGVRTLHRTVSDGDADMDSAARQARHLMHLLDGFAELLRRDSKKLHSGRKLVRTACRFNKLRFEYHRVELFCPLLNGDDDGFRSRFAFNIVLGGLSNLLDNALYWLRVRWPDDKKRLERRLYIGVSHEFDAGPAIVVADNGTGFQGNDPEELVRPFFTRRPDGMGLGLYYTNLAMDLNGGQLVFPQSGEVEIPDGFEGSTVALVFGEKK